MYLNRFIDLGFPELAGNDDSGRAVVWVKIRNPRLIPGQDLLGGANVPVGADGKPVDAVAAGRQTFEMMAKLIIAGNVWDAESLDDEPPLLNMPPSAAEVGRMPMVILNAIGEELAKANPQ